VHVFWGVNVALDDVGGVWCALTHPGTSSHLTPSDSAPRSRFKACPVLKTCDLVRDDAIYVLAGQSCMLSDLPLLCIRIHQNPHLAYPAPCGTAGCTAVTFLPELCKS
jgi:hypothetical protein